MCGVPDARVTGAPSTTWAVRSTKQKRMTTLSGILEWRNGTEGRIRQLEDRILEHADDPFVPIELRERYPLRQGQRVTVSVVNRKSRRRRGRKPRTARPMVEDVLEIEGMPPEQYAARKPFE